MQNSRREDLRSYTPQHLYKSYHICDNHFEESQFKNNDYNKTGIIIVCCANIVQCAESTIQGHTDKTEQDLSMQQRLHREREL